MKESLTVRLMTHADLEFANALRALIGWNQAVSDWERLLDYEPSGCFIAECDGSCVGTTTTTCYGKELAWIGMVLVHPEFRRRGIASRLLEHALNYLREKKIRCIKLDATPLGKPLYEQLGFRDEWSLTRWEANIPDAEGTSRVRLEQIGATMIRPWSRSDFGPISEFDGSIFGVRRDEMLSRLAQGSELVLAASSSSGEITGYGALRNGSRAKYLGPLVCRAPEIGTQLAQALVSSLSNQKVYWDIPDANTAAVATAKQLGFCAQRPLLRMFLGQNTNPGNPSGYFAIADPAIG